MDIHDANTYKTKSNGVPHIIREREKSMEKINKKNDIKSVHIWPDNTQIVYINPAK